MSGKIKNPNTDFVILTLESVPEDIVLDTAHLDDEGRFNIHAKLDKCCPASLFDGRESTHLYLCPGDSLHITLNTTDFDESIKYEGKGAPKNNFLAEYHLKFLEFGKEDFIDFFMIRDTAIQVYLRIVQQHEKACADYLDQSHLQNNFPKEFIRYMDTWIYFGSMESYIYLFYHGGSLDTSTSYEQYSSQVKAHIINGTEYDDPDYLSPYYQWWMYAILPNVLTKNIIEENEDIKDDPLRLDSILYLNLAELLTPFELQLVIFSNIRDLSMSNDLKHMNQLKPIVSRYVNDVDLIGAIDSLYLNVTNKLQQTIPDQAVLYDLDEPEFDHLVFEDILASYRGNVIYLDFWASWCGPCKAEMPFSAELSSKFEGDDVVILYVSTDKDSSAWENMIRIMQLQGLHYRLGKNMRKPVFERFGIEFIPHYVLFDREGEMVKNNMTCPNEPETENMIKELLQ